MQYLTEFIKYNQIRQNNIKIQLIVSNQFFFNFQVTKEKCDNEPYQDCQQVPYEEHKLVPKQVSKRKPFKVCKDIDPYEFSDAEILEYDFSDYDSRIADPRNSGDDEEIIDNEKQVQSDSAITFG